MLKLLNAYRACPTFANARKVRAYERAHSFSLCALSREDADLVAAAIHHANDPGAPAKRFFARGADGTLLRLTNGGGMVEAK